jgi:hypothetical protein
MLKHKWNPETMRSGFYAMLQHAELQEIEHETDVVLGSYWSGIKDALLVAVENIGGGKMRKKLVGLRLK